MPELNWNRTIAKVCCKEAKVSPYMLGLWLDPCRRPVLRNSALYGFCTDGGPIVEGETADAGPGRGAGPGPDEPGATGISGGCGTG